MFDVAVIGGGIVGAAVCDLLSQHHVRSCLIEKSTDVADGTTKANSGIVHAGYDALPGTKMARHNVRGAQLMEGLCRRLGVGYNRCGSLVLSFSPEEDQQLAALFERGRTNGVADLALLSRDETLAMEPSLSPKVRGALYAPSAAIVDPFALCIALAESAALNDTEILLSSPVTQIRREGDHFVICAGDHVIRSRWIVNAAGVHAGTVHEMAGGEGFTIRSVRGEYYLMDKTEGDLVRHVVFQCPSQAGKGVLVAPTVHGNLIIGPNAAESANPDDTATTSEGLAYVREAAVKSVPALDYGRNIRNFAGMRAYSSTGDFVIGLSRQVPHFVNLAWICSPGLSSAPAIAEECVQILEQDGLVLQPKEHVVLRRAPRRVRDMSPDEQNAAVRDDPRYGHVVCRCETVTEGEIMDVLHREPVPRTVDGIKKRLGAGMGRCQGGFCTPRVIRIIANELGLDPEDVLQGPPASNILVGKDAPAPAEVLQDDGRVTGHADEV